MCIRMCMCPVHDIARSPVHLIQTIQTITIHTEAEAGAEVQGNLTSSNSSSEGEAQRHHEPTHHHECFCCCRGNLSYE